MMARITDDAAKDIDETRRLLYMALFCGGTSAVPAAKKYNLAGTIVNAIKHHQGADIDPDAGTVASDALLKKVADYVNGNADPDDTWVYDQIKRCVDTLGD